MTRPAIAAVIPVYNRASVVLEAMASVAAQTAPPACLIVVDDGSADGTPEAVRRWIARHEPPFPTQVIEQSNQGPSAARNRGVDEARRLASIDVLAFLDSDDLWPADYLQRVGDALGADAACVACTADRCNVDLQCGERQLIRWDRIGEKTTERFFVEGPPGTPNTAFRLEAFDAVGGYESTLRTGEDYHLLLKMSLLGAWRHLPGEPVTVRRRIAETRHEAEQISKQYADRRLIRARMLDRFITTEGGAAAIRGRAWRTRLGRAWHAAGRQLLALGRADEARHCFRRAVQVQPAHWRARLRLWLTPTQP